MKSSMRRVLFLTLACAAVSANASAQFVGASVLGDLVRLSRTESVIAESPHGGEALGFAIRIGTPLGAAWGVEAEFARPAEIEDETRNSLLPLLTSPASLTLLPPSSSFPSFSYRTTIRNTTLSASAWLRQPLTDRSSLVYLAGLGFNRQNRDEGFSFDPRVLALTIAPYETRTITYGVRPFVGIEARLGLGEHAQLVPGLRVHGIDDGWLLRPGIGVNWTF